MRLSSQGEQAPPSFLKAAESEQYFLFTFRHPEVPKSSVALDSIWTHDLEEKRHFKLRNCTKLNPV